MAERKHQTDDTPLLEWAVGALGALIFLFMLGVLINAGLRSEGAPLRIAVEVERIVPMDATYVVEFTARNEGEVAATDVEIVGRVQAGDGAIEERRARLDYLPPRGERRGGLIFRDDPSDWELLLSADGYADP